MGSRRQDETLEDFRKRDAQRKRNERARVAAGVAGPGRGNGGGPRPAPPREAAVITAEARREQREQRLTREHKTLTHRLVELEDAFDFLHAGPSKPPVILTPSSRPKTGKRIGTPNFVVSDTHFGERVTRAETLGRNVYNLPIAAKRMSKCWDNMLWLRRDMARTVSCDDTVIYLNGDIVSGDIHDELRETNDGGLRAQCDAAFDALYPGLEAFGEETPGTLHVVCIGGNHGRLTHKQHIKNGTEHSAEHLGVYGPLRKVLGAGKRGNIVWHIPPAERYILDVHGYKISVQHGTMIKSQGGIGGTLVPMTRWVTKDALADLYIFGHFHECDAYRNIIKNGSLIGASAYSKWLGIEDRDPEQAAFMLDADRFIRRFERVSVSTSDEREAA